MFLKLKNAEFEKGRHAPSFAFFALAGLAVLCGCKNDAMPDQRFVDAFVEIRIVESTYGPESPTARIVRQDVIKKFGYTREEFLAETDRILENEKVWVPFQKAVVERIDSLMALPKKAPTTAAPVSSKPSMPVHKGGVQ